MDRRSESYLEAAKQLLNNRQYNSSTALFYYAVFFRMRYVLANAKTNPMSYDSQNPIDQSVHFRVKTEIQNHLSNSNTFEDLFDQLQALREKADYSPYTISLEECTTAQSLAEKIINYHLKSIPLAC